MDAIVNARVIKDYILELTFDDGTTRRVDVEPLLYGDIFEPLRNPSLFRQVVVDKELGTVVWPNGADFSPEFLREAEAVRTL